jgi:large subunit ribosomal protein L25
VKREITVAAEVRTARGKNEARRTRRAGQIPAVLYGAYKDAVSISVNPREILRIVRSSTGYNTIFNLAIEGGETAPVMVVDQQVDPLKGTLLHADLKRIDLTKRIRITVPVFTVGEPAGVKLQGGLLEVITRAIEIECLPDEIPESFSVDVSELMIGQSKRASDVALAASMKLVSAAETVIAHAVALRAEAEPVVEAAPTAEAAVEGAEPEVIKKGKKEEEAAPAEKEKEKEKEKGKKK